MKTSVLFLLLVVAAVRVAAAPPNVLFIAIDDLRDLSSFPDAKMPNLDRLAVMGMKFSRDYCAAPVCNASLASLMSGLRPSTTGVYENNTDGRTVIAGIDSTFHVSAGRLLRHWRGEDRPRKVPAA